MPSLAQTLIIRFGWKTSYSILGASVLLIAWPVVSYFLEENPEDFGLLPDGIPARTQGMGSVGQGLTAGEAWQSVDFWLMVFAFILVSASVQACVVHIAPMLNDRNLGARAAAMGSSLIGAAVMIGRVGTGYLLDRVSAPRVASVLFSASSLGIALLILGSGAGLFAGVFLVGLGLGAEIDLIPYLTSRYFGLLNFGKIYSSAFAAFALAGAVGPLIMGAGFDRTGSYRDPLIAFFLATVIAAALISRLGSYRFCTPQSSEKQPLLAASAVE
jgi:MFS family permease